METSALKGKNIEKAFNELIIDIYKNQLELFEKQDKVKITDKKENKEETKFCCF